MPSPRPNPERIDLAQADDPRDVVHRTVAALAQGETLLLTNGRRSGRLASPLHPEAVERLATAPEGSQRGPVSVLLRGPDELTDWVPGVSPSAARIARRVWPGPVVMEFPEGWDRGLAPRLPDAVGRALFRGGSLALKVPYQPFVRNVLKLVPGPLVFEPWSPGGAGGGPPAADIDPAALGCGMALDSVEDDLGESESVVRVGADGWELVREGAVTLAQLTRLSGTILLFVCTGNTCRSPMAEALCKLLLARRVGCAPSDLEAHGFVVLSAGLAAVAGMPAAAHALDVVASRGGSLQGHASRRLTRELVRQSDLILVMTADHLDALLDAAPEAAPRTRLLHPGGGDVPDPVGADRETYERTARQIESYLTRWLDELGL